MMGLEILGVEGIRKNPASGGQATIAGEQQGLELELGSCVCLTYIMMGWRV